MFVRATLLFFLILIIFSARAFVSPIPMKKLDVNFKPQYGVSYSFEQAEWYGLDPMESYVEMLDEIKPNWVRLPFFWDQMVDENGELKIESLKFAAEEAGKRDIKVVIALGAKTPYYPETHLPEEIKRQVAFGQKITPEHPIADDLLAIDEKLVRELSSYTNISHWQVENEPFLGDERGVSVSPKLVSREIEIVKGADPLRRPVIVNHPAGWYFDNKWRELLAALSLGDVYSTNAYFKTQGTNLIAVKIAGLEVKIPWPNFLVWPVQSWPLVSPPYQKLKEEAQKQGVGFWVMEMQAEPYIRTLADAQKNSFEYSASDLKAASDFLMSYKIDSVGFWGVHFWQFRNKLGDNSWLNTAKNIANQ